MEYKYKFVEYSEYCHTCKNYTTSAIEDPCDECLNNPVNLNSHKPIKYEGDI